MTTCVTASNSIRCLARATVIAGVGAVVTHGPKHDGHPQLGLLEEDLHEGGQHAHLLRQVVRVDLEVDQALHPLGVVTESPIVLRLLHPNQQPQHETANRRKDLWQ